MKKSFNKPCFVAAGIAISVLMAGCATQTAGPGRPERLALVASEADGNVIVVDLNAEKVVKTLPTGKVPHAMAIAPGGRIFVNNRGSKELTVIDGIAVAVAGAVPLHAVAQAYKPEYRLSTAVGPVYPWGKGAAIWAQLIKERTAGRISSS